VVVKNASEPIILSSSAGRTAVAPPVVTRVVDTTAAGDSFNAAFLVNLLAGAPHEECAKAGARVAGKVIAARGALVEI